MKTFSRVLATGFAAAALTVAAAGAASATELTAQDAPIYGAPGLDLSPLLGATTELPAGALGPLFGLFTFLGQ